MINVDVHNVEILLVEDSPQDAKLVKRALDKEGLTGKFYWVKDGEEALNFLFAKGVYQERMVQDRPKVIVLDLKLPKVNGKEVLKQIRENPQSKNIPVVIMSSSKEEQDVKDTYSLGTNGYVVKSLDFADFRKSIAHLGNYWLVTNQPPCLS